MYVHCIHIIYIIFLAIDQVTGVTLTCELVGLMNQCTVMWNVSLHTYTNDILSSEYIIKGT